MAIVKKPGAGITGVFNQATGKLDSAIFSVFGGNLKTLLNQLGVNKLSDLKNIDLSKLDIMSLINLLLNMFLSGSWRNLASWLNIGSINFLSLLSALGLPSNLISILSNLKSLFQGSNGLYPKYKGAPGAKGTFITLAKDTPWSPSDPDDSKLDWNNTPETGTIITIDTEYNSYEARDSVSSSNKVTLGSASLISNMMDIDNDYDLIDAVIAPSDNKFYYIDTPSNPNGSSNSGGTTTAKNNGALDELGDDSNLSMKINTNNIGSGNQSSTPSVNRYMSRYDMSKFIPNSKLGGPDYIKSYFLTKLLELQPAGYYHVTTEIRRIDLISYNIYNGDTSLWWVLLYYNGLLSNMEVVNGVILKYPNIKDIELIYYQLNALNSARNKAA